MLTTSATFASVSSKPGLTARARSTNSATADDVLRAVQGRRLEARRSRQRLDLVHPLSADAQDDPARDEEGRQREGGVQAHELGRGIHDLLEVVEHDEHALVGQSLRDAVLEVGGAAVAHPEGVGDRRQQQPPLEDALEEDEVDPVGEEVGAGPRHLDREPALADAARPDEAQDPLGALGEQIVDGPDIVLAPDGRRVRGRHVTRSGRAAARRPPPSLGAAASNRSARRVARSSVMRSWSSSAVWKGR